jgi:hypothetical protein
MSSADLNTGQVSEKTFSENDILVSDRGELILSSYAQAVERETGREKVCQA